MSQLFDSLRRGRQTRSAEKPRHTAQGDAVLATLGYASARRAGRSKPVVAPMLLLGGALAAGWVGWDFSRAPDARVPARATPSGASRPAAVPPLSVTGSRQEGSPPADHVEGAQPPFAAGASPDAPIEAPPPAAPSRPTGSSGAAHIAARPLPQPSRMAAVAPSVLPAAPANDLDLALYYHRAGDFENALQHYRALLRTNELNAQAHNNLGLLYQERNLLDESARELQRAIVIEPRNAGTHNNYGVTLLKQGRPDEALAQFGAALKLSPRSVDAVVNMALAQRDARQPGLAKETLLGALAIDPRHAAAHYNLAQVYDQANETAGAVEHYRSFLENAGVEYASRAAAVRARIELLSRHPD